MTDRTNLEANERGSENVLACSDQMCRSAKLAPLEGVQHSAAKLLCADPICL